jgi:Ca2+:H+ antiporter
MLATIVAGIARYSPGFPHVVAFVLAGIALAGVAWVVSLATEQVGSRFGPAMTGLMQSTLGNLPEFFVVLFALIAGQRIIAQTAILGSILSNALLVLGLVIIVGARRERDGVMRFSPRLPNDTATLMLMTSFIIVLVGLANGADDSASHHIQAISVVSAIAILIVYGVWVIQYLRSDPTPEAVAQGDAPVSVEAGEGAKAEEAGEGVKAEEAGAAAEPPPARPVPPIAVSLALLVIAGLASAFVSDWFVHGLEPTIVTLHISQAFAGLVIVAIAGNAVEHAVGIVLAGKGHYELAISVVKNSVAQIAAFLFPLLVLVSLLTSTSLTFALAPVYTGALLGTAVIMWQITGDGEATPFEGAALIAAYVILATVAAFE